MKCIQCGAPAGFMTMVCRRCVASPPTSHSESEETTGRATGASRITQYQAQIRVNSGYQALRLLIGIVFVVLGLALIAMLLIGFVSGGVAALVAVVLGAVGVFLLYAAYGASVLLIDLVDAILEQGARRRPRNSPDESIVSSRASTTSTTG